MLRSLRGWQCPDLLFFNPGVFVFTRLDHVTIAVPDLQQGIAQYTKMGFNVHAAGTHPGRGTHNAVAFNTEDYLELLAIRDPLEYAASRGPGATDSSLAAFIAQGGGIRQIAVQSDNLAADVAAMRGRGVDVGDVVEGGRRMPDGRELRWKIAVLGAKNPLPIFFIEHLTPLETRRTQVPGVRAHPNGVYKLERSYIVSNDAEIEAALYARVLGMEKPELHKGTVVMSHMAIFEIGPTGLGVVQPYAPGPAADALERRGPGPFQALYRTTGMGAAARWMEEHGMPPPKRGIRSNGEHAMLATPEYTCGAYIGFVGPE